MEILLVVWIKLNTTNSLVDVANYLNKPVVESKKDEKPPKPGDGRRDERNK